MRENINRRPGDELDYSQILRLTPEARENARPVVSQIWNESLLRLNRKGKDSVLLQDPEAKFSSISITTRQKTDEEGGDVVIRRVNGDGEIKEGKSLLRMETWHVGPKLAEKFTNEVLFGARKVTTCWWEESGQDDLEELLGDIRRGKEIGQIELG